MNRTLLSVYQQLPAPLRNLAATARGYYLRSRRYSSQTEELVEEALEREHWSAAKWESWQSEKLARLLDRAARRVPYYRNLWEERRRRGDRSSWEDVANWPVLEKETVRSRPLELLVEGCDPRRMMQEHTSGTTGSPLRLWISRDALRQWYALFEARCRRWHKLSLQDRWAILGGQLVTPTKGRRPPFWVWNGGMNQLYMSSYHLAPDLLPYYLEALDRYRVKYVLGYTSSLNALGQAALQTGWRGRMRVAITNAEPVFSYQRRAIEKAFQCKVQETYGMSEIAAAASECTEGTLHLWPDAGYIETLRNGTATPAHSAGELICTGLLNTDMPLIRYRVGDRGMLATGDSECSCGRKLPVLSAVEGRVDDVLWSTDGRAIGRLDPLFKGDLPIVEAQIIQESRNRVRMVYVPSAGFGAQTSKELTQLLRDRLGPMEIVLESTGSIPRGANGKFRAVINLVKEPIHER
jgi:phenylacetate-CoA ligase